MFAGKATNKMYPLLPPTAGSEFTYIIHMMCHIITKFPIGKKNAILNI
jgi:hypothetical protein